MRSMPGEPGAAPHPNQGGDDVAGMGGDVGRRWFAADQGVARSVGFDLPYPPSSNRIWRHAGGRVYLPATIRKYWWEIKTRWLEIETRPLTGNLAIDVMLLPRLTVKGQETKRRLDLDNCLKTLIDGCQAAGVFHNDRQIVEIHAEIGPARRGGGALVTVRERRDG